MESPIVVLTGAGISAESGIQTFRASDGLWENHRVEDVATPGAFFRNPALVQKFYNERRRKLLDPGVQPNAAHIALAKLEKEWRGDFLLVTQNIDNLHERAGSKKVLHMHGELLKIFCVQCREVFACEVDLAVENNCEKCRAQKTLRPDIVWFEEMPYHMDVIVEALKKCQLFVSIGTSGNVYPAAGFVQMAHRAHKVEVNLDSSQISSHFHEHLVGPASQKVVEFTRRFLA